MKLLVLILLVIGCKEVVPLPSPTPEPSATPCACPSATPIPSPSPSPSPTATPWACNLPAMPNCANNTPNCCREGGTKKYYPMIQTAQAELVKRSPWMFKSDGSLTVSDIEYTTALAKVFQDVHKICAVGGSVDPVSKDEIGIKETNGQSTNVDVIIGGSAKPWTGTEYTCNPAAF